MSSGRAASADFVEKALRISAALDVRFHDLKGDAVVTSKDGAFRELFRILEASGLDYALGPRRDSGAVQRRPAFAFLVESAARKSFEGGQVRVATPSALVKEKLRAASDPARRESKRFQDLTDAKSLAEEHPEVEGQLTPAERVLLKRTL